MWSLLSAFFLSEDFVLDMFVLFALGISCSAFGLILAVNIANNKLSSFFGYVAFLGFLLLIEITFIKFFNSDCCDDSKNCFQDSLKKYPIEYREETNKLYVFKDGVYKELHELTKEYAEKNDTLYYVSFKKIHRNLIYHADECITVKKTKVKFLKQSQQDKKKKHEKIQLLFDEETGKFVDTTSTQTQ